MLILLRTPPRRVGGVTASGSLPLLHILSILILRAFPCNGLLPRDPQKSYRGVPARPAGAGAAFRVRSQSAAPHGALSSTNRFLSCASVLLVPHGGALPPPLVGPAELSLAALPVLATAVLLRALRLRPLSRSVLLSSARLSLQLLLFGGALLRYLFRPRASPLPVLLWIALASTIAAREAAVRVPHTYAGMGRDCAAASAVGVGAVLLYARAFILRDATPFWSGAAVVPLAGILYGNAAARTGTCLTVALAEAAGGRDRIEARLAAGASVWEATRPMVGEAVGAALAPTLTQMAGTGLVAMPGVMTGSILAGRDPAQAAAYQIAVFFCICASSCVSSLLVAGMVVRKIFDVGAVRLLPEDESTLRRRHDPPVPAQPAPATAPHTSALVRTAAPSPEVVLTVRELTVRRTDLTVSFDLTRGERLGIVGRSGVGKSQLLRTVARLEAAAGRGSTTLRPVDGRDAGADDSSTWRARVAWVSQDRPTFPGTPRDLHREVCSYRARRSGPAAGDLARHCAEWSLDPAALDRPWGALSGGEAQRAALAVALAGRPEVLLLDEPTSACDAETTEAIERTLVEIGIPVVIVSHSQEQIGRFCTGVLSLT